MPVSKRPLKHLRHRGEWNPNRRPALAPMFSLETLVGLVAAAGTTFSYLPQVMKCWRTGATGDLSLKMFVLLASGVALWVVYGFMKGDFVIIAANVVSLLFLANILFFKIREVRARGGAGGAGPHPAAGQA